jgi:DUF1680 family protein
LPPGWSVNDIEADPASIVTQESGTTIEVRRRADDPAHWPYFSALAAHEAERTRARLNPYHEWANRGPVTMRAWLPLAMP